jgi:hypothetical protein
MLTQALGSRGWSAAMAARYRLIDGTVVNSGSVRTFVDGQYCSRITVKREHGGTQSIERVFIPGSLLHCVYAGSNGKFYFWNRHLYACRTAAGINYDIDGARHIFFRRDKHILVALVLTIVLAPVAIWVVVRRAMSAGTANEMRQFL